MEQPGQWDQLKIQLTAQLQAISEAARVEAASAIAQMYLSQQITPQQLFDFVEGLQIIASTTSAGPNQAPLRRVMDEEILVMLSQLVLTDINLDRDIVVPALVQALSDPARNLHFREYLGRVLTEVIIEHLKSDAALQEQWVYYYFRLGFGILYDQTERKLIASEEDPLEVRSLVNRLAQVFRKEFLIMSGRHLREMMKGEKALDDNTWDAASIEWDKIQKSIRIGGQSFRF